MKKILVENLLEAGVSFDEAITYHLKNNLFPPIPDDRIDDIKALCRASLAVASNKYYEKVMKDLEMRLELPPCLIDKDNDKDFMTVEEVIKEFSIQEFIGKEQVYEF